VQRLGDQDAVVDAAEQHAIQLDGPRRLGRRALHDLRQRAGVAEPQQRRAHALEGLQRRDRPALGHQLVELAHWACLISSR
jgi:hypothetical protein